MSQGLDYAPGGVKADLLQKNAYTLALDMAAESKKGTDMAVIIENLGDPFLKEARPMRREQRRTRKIWNLFLNAKTKETMCTVVCFCQCSLTAELGRERGVGVSKHKGNGLIVPKGRGETARDAGSKREFLLRDIAQKLQ